MKICKICKEEFEPKQSTEKYCSTDCAYTAIDLKRRNRNKRCLEVKCIACNGKGVVKRLVRSVLTEKQKKNILLLYRKGYGIREIQRAIKVSHPYTVTYYIKTCNK